MFKDVKTGVSMYLIWSWIGSYPWHYFISRYWCNGKPNYWDLELDWCLSEVMHIFNDVEPGFFWLIMINPGHIPSQAKKVQHYIQLTITSSTSIFCLYVDLELQHLVDIDSLWGTSQTSSDLAHLINVRADINATMLWDTGSCFWCFLSDPGPIIVYPCQ